VHRAKAKEVRKAYTWESFARNNLMSVKSGVGSERIITRLAEQLADWAVERFPDLAAERYRFALTSWARAESIAALITRRLDSIGIFGENGEARGMLNSLRTAERRAAEERGRLGLSPSDHARLERERSDAVRGAADLGELRAAGREGDQARARNESEET
jgi:hypothetical protein